MTKRNKVFVVCILAVLAISIGGCGKTNSSDANPTNTNDTTVNERVIEIAQVDCSQNTLTVINVWGTWCPPCVEELPELQQLSEAYSEKGVQVVGVLQDGVNELGEPDVDIIESANLLLDTAGVEYPVILPDENFQLNVINWLQFFPATLLKDKHGNTLDFVYGANTFEDWCKIIDETLEDISE